MMLLVCQLENLLLDIAGNIKISDFGLSAISDQVKVQSDNNQITEVIAVLFVSLHFANFTTILEQF